MNNRKEVLSFMIYMWNTWSKEECAYVFNNTTNLESKAWDFSIGSHIWNKWLHITQTYGTMGAAERLVAELDENNLNKLVERACSIYCGRDLIKR